MKNGTKNPNHDVEGGDDWMYLVGPVCRGRVWAKRGKAAYAALDAGASDTGFYEAKIATGKYYMARCLPITATHLARIESGADTVMALEAEQF